MIILHEYIFKEEKPIGIEPIRIKRSRIESYRKANKEDFININPSNSTLVITCSGYSMCVSETPEEIDKLLERSPKCENINSEEIWNNGDTIYVPAMFWDSNIKDVVAGSEKCAYGADTKNLVISKSGFHTEKEAIDVAKGWIDNINKLEHNE